MTKSLKVITLSVRSTTGDFWVVSAVEPGDPASFSSRLTSDCAVIVYYLSTGEITK